MQIGELAVIVGLNIQTLRYYERRGLLPNPRRRDSGYREYDPDTVELVRFIKRAQGLGFTLGEIAELVQLRKADRPRSTQVRALATTKLEEIEQKLRRLGAMRQALLGLVQECACEGKAPDCPIIEALNDPSEQVTPAGATER